MSAAALIWGTLFGAVGAGYFIYGKRQQMFVPMICGLALAVYPWFVSGTFWTLAIGVVLIGVPYFVRY